MKQRKLYRTYGVTSSIVLLFGIVAWGGISCLNQKSSDILSREIKRMRERRAPLSFPEAVSYGLIDPPSEAQKKYDELMAIYEKDLEVRNSVVRTTEPAKLLQTEYATTNSSAIHEAIKEFERANVPERLYDAISDATKFPVWSPTSEWTGTFEMNLELVSLIELLCASSIVEIAMARTERGMDRLRGAHRISKHLCGQPHFYPLSAGSLGLRIVYETATAINAKHPYLGNQLLAIGSDQPTFPDASLYFKLYMASDYQDRFGGAASPDAGDKNKIAWMRTVLKVIDEVDSSGTPSFMAYADSLKKHNVRTPNGPDAVNDEWMFTSTAEIIQGMERIQSGAEDSRVKLMELLR